MKKLNQHLLLAAAMMLMAGSAYAQTGPTNQYKGAPVRAVTSPGTAPAAPANVAGASKGTYSTNYNDYSQDSYVSQTGSNNYATVDQVNTGNEKGFGNTATLTQTGDNNKASQSQSSTGSSGRYYYTGDNRNFMSSTQNGSGSQTQQTQASGNANVATILQGAGTTGNRAIQTQGVDATNTSKANQAVINQTKYQAAGGGSGNYAEQVQTGELQTARIDQEASKSYAKQTQKGGNSSLPQNSAYIHQGDPGTANTAEQSQNGLNNVARIQQGIGGTTNNSYAMQTQTGNNNQADIDQHSTTNSYAEQMQSNNNNYSTITQSNVASAAYTTQTGASNTAIVTQH